MLQRLFSNPLSRPPARIELWALRLMNFDFEIIHRPGKFNIADYLSRYPLKTLREDNDRFEEETERYMYMVTVCNIPKSLTLEEVRKFSLEDECLRILSKWLRGNTINQAEKLKIEPFSRISQDLSLYGDIVLRGDKLVLPVALYNKALNIAHEGHLGITRTKTLIRSKIWFPNIN